MRRNPPWVSANLSGLNFTVTDSVNITDLHGDIVDPQLVIFFSGNQFMVTHDLVSAFQERYPQYQRIYWETLPPGILI